jgi:hypothetical protein
MEGREREYVAVDMLMVEEEGWYAPTKGHSVNPQAAVVVNRSRALLDMEALLPAVFMLQIQDYRRGRR